MVISRSTRSQSRGDKKLVDTNDYSIFTSSMSPKKASNAKSQMELVRKLKAAKQQYREDRVAGAAPASVSTAPLAKQQASNAPRPDVSPMRSRR